MVEGKVQVRSRALILQRRAHATIQKRLNGRALACRTNLSNAYEGAGAGRRIQSDTGASAASFYCAWPGFNDYDNKVSEAFALYLSPGRWVEVIRKEKHIPDSYTAQHFADRILPRKEAPNGSEHRLFSLCSSCFAVVLWWEEGHDNKLFGPKPAIGFVAAIREEMQAEASRYFRNLLALR